MAASQKINPALRKQIDASFYQVIADIKTPEDAKQFFANFITESELDNLVKRLAIAYWIKKGRTYENIKTNLKVSSASIAGVVAKMDTTGFQKALKLLEADEWANVWSERINRFTK